MSPESSASTPAEPERFLADAMLGNVAKELRLLGYDALYAGRRTDSEILRWCQADGRILVTRDLALARRCRSVRCLVVCEADPSSQTIEVLQRLRMAPSPDTALSRCLECNGLLAVLTRDDAWHQVPDHVALSHTVFRGCPDCGRVYWPGGHMTPLRTRIRRILASLQAGSTQV